MKTKKKAKYLRGVALTELASREAPVLRGRDFLPAVDVLRAKGFSWRECSKWLSEHAGVGIDHTYLMRLSQDREIVEEEVED